MIAAREAAGAKLIDYVQAEHSNLHVVNVQPSLVATELIAHKLSKKAGPEGKYQCNFVSSVFTVKFAHITQLTFSATSASGWLPEKLGFRKASLSGQIGMLKSYWSGQERLALRA